MEQKTHSDAATLRLVITWGSQSSSSSTSAVNGYTTQSIGTSIFKKRKLFQYDDRSLSSNFSTLMNPVSELNAYINDPVRTKFSSYWKNSQLSSLKHVVKRLFSVQALSAPIERVFSQAGVIMSPRRTSMREEVYRNLVFSRVNQSLI